MRLHGGFFVIATLLLLGTTSVSADYRRACSDHSIAARELNTRGEIRAFVDCAAAYLAEHGTAEARPRRLIESEERFWIGQACREFRWTDWFPGAAAPGVTRNRLIRTSCRYRASVPAGSILEALGPGRSAGPRYERS